MVYKLVIHPTLSRFIKYLCAWCWGPGTRVLGLSHRQMPVFWSEHPCKGTASLITVLALLRRQHMEGCEHRSRQPDLGWRGRVASGSRCLKTEQHIVGAGGEGRDESCPLWKVAILKAVRWQILGMLCHQLALVLMFPQQRLLPRTTPGPGDGSASGINEGTSCQGWIFLDGIFSV